MIDKRPALIARCASTDEVVKAVGFARDHDLPLAIRGGAHNGAGLGTVDDGVVIDLSLLRDIQVDPQARTVRVGGGCTWGEVDRATGEHGLATPSGIISTTGVGGLTLGGGLGHLTRKCGLAIDNLLEADVVLANGEQVRASADEHPDLYWAIRGGGGNFGAGTSLLLRLHEAGTVDARPIPRSVDAHAGFGAEMPTGQSTMHLYPIDGAAHDVSSAGTPWSYRDAKWATVYAGVDPDPANVGAIRDWTVGYFEALHPYSAGGAYVNMMMDEGQERVRASYRDNYERLARVKAAYDPENGLRINQNIRP